MNTIGEDERDRERHHDPGAQAEAEEADAEHDRNRLPQRLHELVDRVLDRDRLVGDQRGLDADRQVRRDLAPWLRSMFLPKRQDVAAVAHGDGEADARARR